MAGPLDVANLPAALAARIHAMFDPAHEGTKVREIVGARMVERHCEKRNDLNGLFLCSVPRLRMYPILASRFATAYKNERTLPSCASIIRHKCAIECEPVKQLGFAMGHYILRIFDPAQKVAQMLERDYSDDLNALEAAEALAEDCAVEVWDDHHRIASVKKGRLPSQPGDPFPG